MQPSDPRRHHAVGFRIRLRFVPVTERFKAAQPAVIRSRGVRAQALLNQVQRRVGEPCFGRGETGHFTGA